MTATGMLVVQAKEGGRTVCLYYDATALTRILTSLLLRDIAEEESNRPTATVCRPQRMRPWRENERRSTETMRPKSPLRHLTGWNEKGRARTFADGILCRR